MQLKILISFIFNTELSVLIFKKLSKLFKTLKKMKSSAIFEEMKTRVEAVDPNGPRTVIGIFQYNITAADGVHNWIVDLKNLKVSEGTTPSPDVTMSASDDDFALVVTKEVSVADAIASGKLKIEGDQTLADALLAKIST